MEVSRDLGVSDARYWRESHSTMNDTNLSIRWNGEQHYMRETAVTESFKGVWCTSCLL